MIFISFAVILVKEAGKDAKVVWTEKNRPGGRRKEIKKMKARWNFAKENE